MFTRQSFIQISGPRAARARNLVARFRVVLIWLLTVCCGLQVRAQVNTGTLSGQIEDASGAVVPGATLTVTEQTTGFSRQAKTDGDGTYVFPDLPIGLYTVTVEANGFETVKGTATINVGFSRSLRLSSTRRIDRPDHRSHREWSCSLPRRCFHQHIGQQGYDFRYTSLPA